MNTPNPDRYTVLAGVGYAIVLATLIGVAGLQGMAGAAVLAGLWPVLAPVGLIAAITVATAVLIPASFPIVAVTGLGLGVGLFIVATTTRPGDLPSAFLGTTAIAAILAVAAIGGWVWTTTLWGVALTLASTATLIAYLLHRYTVALTETTA